MNTIIAAFCDTASAQQALQFLRTRGITNTQLLTYADGDLPSTLSRHDVPDDRARLYAEIMRRGATVILAHVEDDAKNLARELDRMGSLDLDAAEKRWRSEGWTRYDANTVPYTADECAREQAQLRRESALESRSAEGSSRAQAVGELDVIEERAQIGTREVERGVRVRTYVVERPVQEQVKLRDERIQIDREAADELVSPSAADSTFTEEEFVVSATSEEAVVGKQARVVERVHIGKTAEERTETVEATERRREVEVEPLEGEPHRRG